MDRPRRDSFSAIHAKGIGKTQKYMRQRKTPAATTDRSRPSAVAVNPAMKMISGIPAPPGAIARSITTMTSE